LNSLIVDFNQMAGRLESLVAAQRMLLRDVSHELRSPLARLSVALQFTRETAPGSMMVPLDRIEAEAGRLNGLIEQILSLSFMEAVQELSNCAEISLSDLVASIMPDIQYEASSRPCHVMSKTIQDSTVHGDPDLLQRALENVVRNAMRYTPQEGMIEIEVDRAGGEHAEMAILRVKDNGPGVPSEELESILRPFYRVDKSRQRSTGGFGVGLAIAERAVHLHAGSIRASNRPQGGLLVEMTFPASSGSASGCAA
jgi:two-component system sensor histidine kinase CpxA